MRDTQFDIYDELGWHRVYPLEECFESIRYRVQHQDEIIEALREENEQLKDEKWKDVTLQELKKERDTAIANARRGFEITEEAEAAINKWQKQHIAEKHNNNSYHGAIGGNWRYEFTPTSIGTIGVCICSTCASKIDKDMAPYINESLSFRLDKKDQLVEFYDSEFVFENI